MGRNNFVGEAHKFFITYGIRAKSFESFDAKFFGRVVTTGFCVSRWRFFVFLKERMKENFFFEKFALLLFSNFEPKRSLVILQASLRQACQKLVVHVQTKVYTNQFFGRLINFSSFPEIQQIFFRVLTRNFRQGGHNCIMHVHRNILRNFFILSKNSWFFSVVFGIWAANLWIFGEKIFKFC